MSYLAVGIGGIFGALSRYYISSYVGGCTISSFPYGTLTVNLLGSFLLSFIAYSSLLNWNLPRKYLVAVNTGVIGSFTTFSTFSVETLNLLIHAKYGLAAIYVIVSLIGGLGLSWFGIYLAVSYYQKIKGEKDMP